jgi:hypothetical protein
MKSGKKISTCAQGLTKSIHVKMPIFFSPKRFPVFYLAMVLSSYYILFLFWMIYHGTPDIERHYQVRGPSRIVGNDMSRGAMFGRSIAVSEDGNVALVGAPFDEVSGTAWMFVRDETNRRIWHQHGPKIRGRRTTDEWNYFTSMQFGWSVALTSDGTIGFIGKPRNNRNNGGVEVVIRLDNRTFIKHSQNIFGEGGGNELCKNFGQYQGDSVSVSADGSVVFLGTFVDKMKIGTAWVFIRDAAGLWLQQGTALGLYGGEGPGCSSLMEGQRVFRSGNAVAVSGDGTTALIGAPQNQHFTGGIWAFVRKGTSWFQEGPSLLGTNATGCSLEFMEMDFYPTVGAAQGNSVAISYDGNTAIVGGSCDNEKRGAVWVFTRTETQWTQQGSKLFRNNSRYFGQSVALSNDGNTALIGGLNASWVFKRYNSVWTQWGPKLTVEAVPRGLGATVALSGDEILPLLEHQTTERVRFGFSI